AATRPVGHLQPYRVRSRSSRPAFRHRPDLSRNLSRQALSMLVVMPDDTADIERLRGNCFSLRITRNWNSIVGQPLGFPFVKRDEGFFLISGALLLKFIDLASDGIGACTGNRVRPLDPIDAASFFMASSVLPRGETVATAISAFSFSCARRFAASGENTREPLSSMSFLSASNCV